MPGIFSVLQLVQQSTDSVQSKESNEQSPPHHDAPKQHHHQHAQSAMSNGHFASRPFLRSKQFAIERPISSNKLPLKSVSPRFGMSRPTPFGMTSSSLCLVAILRSKIYSKWTLFVFSDSTFRRRPSDQTMKRRVSRTLWRSPKVAESEPDRRAMPIRRLRALSRRQSPGQ